MSVPVAPKKACYGQLRDPRNGVTNNNETVLSLGDRNANQIVLEAGPPRAEPKTCGQADGAENGNSRGLEDMSNKEFHRHLGSGKDSQGGPASQKVGQAASRPVFPGGLSEHTMGASTALLMTPWGVQGPSLSDRRNPFDETCPSVSTKRDAEVPKEKSPRTVDCEERRKHSIERGSGHAFGTEALTKDCVGSLAQPASGDSTEAPHRGSGAGGKPPKPLPDHSEDTTEDKTGLRPKPATSEAKQDAPLEALREGGDTPSVSLERTPQPPGAEPSKTLPSKGIPSQPEAQSTQGQGELTSELKCAQELTSTRAECPEAPKEERPPPLERKEPHGKAEAAYSPQEPGAGSRLPHCSLHPVGLGGGGPDGPGVHQQDPGSLRAAESLSTGTVSPSIGRKLGETPPGDILAGDGEVASAPGDPLAGEKRSPAGSGHEDVATGCISGPSAKECDRGGPDALIPHSGSADTEENTKTMTAPVAETRDLPEDPAETESPPAGASPLPSVPPSLRVPTVTVTHQPIPASSSGHNLGTLAVDAGSSVAVPPAPDSAQVLNTSSSGIPKPVLTHLNDTPSPQEGMENGQMEKADERAEVKPVIMPKPKHVRPKIITYIRRSPQTLGQVDTSLVPVGLPYTPPVCSLPLPKEEKTSSGDLKPPAALYEKFKPDLQKPRVFSSGLVVSGIKPPGHHFSQMSEKFLQEVTEHPGKEDFCPPPYAHYEVPPTFYRSAMLLKPQLGLGAMSRLPSTKSRILIASQRSSASALHPPGPVAAAASLYATDPSADPKKTCSSNATKSNLPKSGLRPPGYSRLPAAKLAALGFVRSASVSSVSSSQSADSAHPEPTKTNRPAFGNEDQPALKATLPSKDAPRVTRAAPPAPSSVTPSRRSLLPAPKPTAVPTGTGTKKEGHKEQETHKPAVSSPKRSAASTPKPHSPGYPKQRTAAPRNGFPPKPDLQAREAERQLVQRLKDRCEEQAGQLRRLRAELGRAVCGFGALAVSTQHFYWKNESALVKEKQLRIELASIRDEVAFTTAKYEKLQQEREELEKRFEAEVRGLRWQQQEVLRALEERLQLQFEAEVLRMQEEHQGQLLRIRCQHEEQVEDIAASHEATLLEMESNHTVTIAILQDGHDHKVQELVSAHELEKQELEQSFEKLRLSLQDQVDTLTFQSQSLRDRARRFEEALRKNTEEQLEVALAPYQHLEEDLRSLQQVLEMKNQQIHLQEKKIVELGKLAEKNVILEEKIQVLRQQNEDLRARIDQNTVVTRQLSEENANLQEYVEKETQEKKRLSRTNEELLWKLQTGDPTSPVKLSPTSPIYRCSSSGPPSPARVSTTPR
ncbi:microtubule-associated tumor suppressor candidate 2 [Tenrec ecaudatus]|uniref:microtubule-associated tumor suppressor candidate 2 n=1 Tax=Tenrec ecaudatus TaxID=94439 RepID=UPI003F5A9B0B